MLHFTKGNLLDAEVDALVNTVNTVGVMGKGIALMFKEAFPENYKVYEKACKNDEVQLGRMFVTERDSFLGPKWIINFPTKGHWRQPSKLEWISDGLHDLKKVIEENDIRSIAIPPLGSGNGGLNWSEVRELIVEALEPIENVEVIVYEPTSRYQNVEKRRGVKELTPARALIAELVRRYSILSFDCSLLEVQKLAYFLEKSIKTTGLKDPLDLRFEANRYGPYAHRLTKLLERLDGSFLFCDKRIADASPLESIRFNQSMKEQVLVYLRTTEANNYRDALEHTAQVIDGFETAMGLELLSTVDWMITKLGVEPSVEAVTNTLNSWPGGKGAGARKVKLFDRRKVSLAIDRLAPNGEFLTDSLALV